MDATGLAAAWLALLAGDPLVYTLGLGNCALVWALVHLAQRYIAAMERSITAIERSTAALDVLREALRGQR